MIHALRAEDALLLGQEQVDLARRHLRQRQLPDLRLHDVLTDREDRALVRRLVAEEGVDPPGHQLRDRPAPVLEVGRFEPELLPLEPALEIDRQPPCLRLRRGRRRLRDPPPGAVADTEVPGLALEEDRRHG
jgi:hypothetical protein